MALQQDVAFLATQGPSGMEAAKKGSTAIPDGGVEQI